MRDHIVQLIERGQSSAVRDFVAGRWALPVLPYLGKGRRHIARTWLGGIVPSIVEDRPFAPVKREIGLLDGELLAARFMLAHESTTLAAEEAIVLIYDRNQARTIDLPDGRWGLVLGAEPDNPITVCMFVRRSRRVELADLLAGLAKRIRQPRLRHFRTLAARWWPDAFRRPTPPP